MQACREPKCTQRNSIQQCTKMPHKQYVESSEFAAHRMPCCLDIMGAPLLSHALGMQWASDNHIVWYVLKTLQRRRKEACYAMCLEVPR